MAPPPISRPRKSRARKKVEEEDVPQFPEFDIPYFAHQQLDPSKYSLSISLPVGKPEWAPAPKEIATAGNGGWGEDVGAPTEEDFDYGSSLNSPITPISKGSRSDQQESNPYKRLKVSGGRPVVAKKITADLDSDDELIVRMKNAKYLEKDIAKRLIEEGRTAYHPKTIGTRWARLKKAIQRRQDELLDADMTDWHEGDDEVLEEAIRKADVIVAKAKADADSRKWKIVADEVKNLKPVCNFSHNACRSRYESLQTGTAKPTPESIEHPSEEILERVRSRRDRERQIDEDKCMTIFSPVSISNIEGNGWTSKQGKYL